MNDEGWWYTSGRIQKMLLARDIAPRAIGTLLRGQPLTPAKVRFAWHASVGASMGRATSVYLRTDGTLTVVTSSEHWRRETLRSVGVIKRRLAELLGKNVVKQVAVKGRL